jgi:hypothetical protein
MSIVKTSKKRDVFTKKAPKPFASIMNATLRDSRLSYRARGILASLLSRPDNWKVILQDVVNNGTEGTDSVRACFRELKEFGYAKLIRFSVGGSRWIICEDPKAEMGENGISGEGIFPEVGQNGVLKNKRKEGEKSTNDRSATEKGDAVIHNEIYDAYPKHVGKPAALRAIKAALKKFKKEDHALSLLEVTKLYAKAMAGANPDFIPNPSTWFNQERYNDNPLTWKPRADKKASTNSVINASNSNRDAVGDY